jgi:hypothetical protein
MLAFNSILSKNNKNLAISSFFLCLISLRGTITCAGLIIFDVFYTLLILKDGGFKRLFSYLPGIFAIFSYLSIHYLSRGWAIHNSVSNAWSSSAQLASPSIMLKNVAVLALRIFEYGRIIIALVFLFMLFRTQLFLNNIHIKTIFLGAICQAIIFFPLVISYQNQFSTRYFLPFIILLNISVVAFLLFFLKRKNFVFILLITNICGYFVVYPQKIAMSWDCTPAHWPYYSLRENILNFVENENIKPSDISGGFSIYGNQKNKDLKRNYTINQEPIKKYYIHTNISNPTDEIIKEFNNHSKWKIIKRVEKTGVFVELYKLNNDTLK